MTGRLAAACALTLMWAAPADAHVSRTVQPGETLWSIAYESNLATDALAAANGLPETTQLLTGQTIAIPTGAEAAEQPAPEPARVTSEDVGEVAIAHGVSPSLAAAVAWQESGFNNAMVSSADARGVMQVVPGTWSWVEGSLLGRQLNEGSPSENIHVGVLYLAQLIRDAGGDEARAVAGYYQGPTSVRQIGVLPETQQYVDNVTALRSRFGG